MFCLEEIDPSIEVGNDDIHLNQEHSPGVDTQEQFAEINFYEENQNQSSNNNYGNDINTIASDTINNDTNLDTNTEASESDTFNNDANLDTNENNSATINKNQRYN